MNTREKCSVCSHIFENLWEDRYTLTRKKILRRREYIGPVCSDCKGNLIENGWSIHAGYRYGLGSGPGAHLAGRDYFIINGKNRK